VDYDYFANPGRAPAAKPVDAPQPSADGQPSSPGWTPPPDDIATVLPQQTVPPVDMGTVLPQQTAPAEPQRISAYERTLLAGSAATSYEHMQDAPSAYRRGSKLGFFGSIRVGFQLIPVCWSVLMQELSLLIVPLVVLLLGTLLLLGYSAGFGGVDGLIGANKVDTAARIFPILVVLMILSVLGQAVIVAASMAILDGDRSSPGTAWMTALNQLPKLAGFGVVYACERTLTGLLRGRRRWSPTTIAANALDRAWDFATFLAIPVLLYENVGVFEAVKRSGRLVAQRWGVQLTARSVLGLALFVAALPLLVIGLLVAVGVSAVLGIVLILIVLLGQIALAGALTGVLSAALYHFGTTGLVAPGFTEADMWAAFDQR
jgi:hypothetical protein